MTLHTPFIGLQYVIPKCGINKNEQVIHIANCNKCKLSIFFCSAREQEQDRKWMKKRLFNIWNALAICGKPLALSVMKKKESVSEIKKKTAAKSNHVGMVFPCFLSATFFFSCSSFVDLHIIIFNPIYLLRRHLDAKLLSRSVLMAVSTDSPMGISSVPVKMKRTDNFNY